MNLYFDCEFTGLHKDTTLISIGIVAENGKKFYAELLDFDWEQVNDWIKENVLENFILEKLYAKVNGDIIEKTITEWKENGYEVSNLPVVGHCYGVIYETAREKDDLTEVVGEKDWIKAKLARWLQQFDSVQFVSDVCHYDFVLLIDLFGSAWDLPKNVFPVCHDINAEIARHYGISDAEAFDKSREEIVKELCGQEIEGRKHNALYDAEVIKAIYEEVKQIQSSGGKDSRDTGKAERQ